MVAFVGASLPVPGALTLRHWFSRASGISRRSSVFQAECSACLHSDDFVGPLAVGRMGIQSLGVSGVGLSVDTIGDVCLGGKIAFFSIPPNLVSVRFLPGITAQFG